MRLSLARELLAYSFQMKCQQSEQTCVCVFNTEAVSLSLHLCFGALLCSTNSGKCHSIWMRSGKSVHSATGAAVLRFLAFSSMQPGCLLHFQKYLLVTWRQKISLTLFMCATAKNSAVQPSWSLHYVWNNKSQTPAHTDCTTKNPVLAESWGWTEV